MVRAKIPIHDFRGQAAMLGFKELSKVYLVLCNLSKKIKELALVGASVRKIVHRAEAVNQVNPVDGRGKIL